MPNPRLLILLCMASILVMQGCAHYEVGDGSAATPFSTLEISPVRNDSHAPQANHVVNHDLRETFIQNGAVSIISGGADAILDVTLTNYTRDTIATSSQDTGLARKYTLSLVASCTLHKPGQDQPYFQDRMITAEVDIFLDSGQTQAETQAIPLLSKQLAQRITNEVLNVW